MATTSLTPNDDAARLALQAGGQAPAGRWWQRALVHHAAWAVMALVFSLAQVESASRAGVAVEFWPTLVQMLPTLWLWALFSWTAHEWLLSRRSAVGPRHVLALALLSTLTFFPFQVVVYAMVSAWFAERPLPSLAAVIERPPPLIYLLYDLIMMAGALAFVSAWVIFWRDTQNARARQQAESELLTAKLQLEQQRLERLRAQLEPHFMFNALNAIAGLVRRADQPAALSAISELSDLLRYALRASSREWVTLSDELDFLHGYLALQRLRFGERLGVRIAVSDSLLNFPCPPLLLQPLVENAIRHGIEPMREPGVVELLAEMRDQELFITVRNPYLSGMTQPGFGIGLTGLRERLWLIYKGRAEITTVIEERTFEVNLKLVDRDDD
ncbi:sensor histidine kinase [Pseudomarimonas arenosa]|uniref:Histidine kinase n=1 Tax=Pseudomarimonas arenosa TaxID=2774145 RepID=A0AAW3ZN75_9GAMM|nr:histidine kinase [Pseudomarimonas arenosa]MBD8526955.1 histidine kinase [Pseudomarimonas arenosa]